jgi:hypothetical protein
MAMKALLQLMTCGQSYWLECQAGLSEFQADFRRQALEGA